LASESGIRPGREPINPYALAAVRFGAHHGLRSDIARGPKKRRQKADFNPLLLDHLVGKAARADIFGTDPIRMKTA